MRVHGQPKAQVEFKYMLAIAMVTVGTIGAIAGSAIGATAMTYDSSHGYEMPDNASLRSFVGESEATAPLPDHYAMKTPDGVIEVAELQSRGLYASPRFADRGLSYPEYSDPDPAEIQEGPAYVPVTYEAPSRDTALIATDEATGVTVVRGTAKSVATVTISAEEKTSTIPLRPLFQGG